MEYYKKYRLIQNIDFTESINQLIHFFHKLPIISRLSGDKYRLFGLKKVVYILGPVLSLLIQAIKSLASMAICLIFTGFILWLIKTPGAYAEDRTRQFIGMAWGNYAFLSFYLTPALVNDSISGNKALFYKLNNQYKLEAKEASLIYGVFEPLRIAIGRFFPFIIVLGFKRALLISLILVFIRLMAASYNLKKSETGKRGLTDKIWFLLLLQAGVFASLMGIKELTMTILLPVFTLTLAGFIFAIRFLFAYDKYDRLLEVAKREKDNIDLDYDLVSNESLKLKDSDLGGVIEGEKKGYNLLNSLFFARHKRLIAKPIQKKAGIIFISLTLGLLAVKYVFTKFIGPLENYSLAGVAIVVMLIFNDNESNRAFFLNCDRALMQYGFYRDEDAVYTMYKLRYKSLLKLNIPGLLAGLGSLLAHLVLFSQEDPSLALLSGGFILACYFFYPAFNLFAYYIFQPFTYEARLVGGIYKGLIAAIGYVNVLIFPLLVGVFEMRAVLILGIMLALYAYF